MCFMEKKQRMMEKITVSKLEKERDEAWEYREGRLAGIMFSEKRGGIKAAISPVSKPCIIFVTTVRLRDRPYCAVIARV